MLLVHGAWSVEYRAASHQDSRDRWIAEKQQTLGTWEACVAVANKNARIIWGSVQLRHIHVTRPVCWHVERFLRLVALLAEAHSNRLRLRLR